jgi:hypothetical protein
VIDDVKIYNGEEEIGSFSKEDAQGVPSQVLGPKAVSAI